MNKDNKSPKLKNDTSIHITMLPPCFCSFFTPIFVVVLILVVAISALNVLRVCRAMAAGRLLLVLSAVFYLLDCELGVKHRP